MILLWGLPGDRPLTAVHDALCQQGHEIALVDQRMVLETAIELFAGTSLTGTIMIQNRSIDLARVTAFYIRSYCSTDLPLIQRAGQGSLEWQHAINVDDVLLSWAELTPATVVNRPSAMASNNSKPYQASFIQSVGFEVPATLITTDPEAVADFHHQYGEVIYKSISGVRSIVSRLTDAHAQRIADITWCPTQFQEYVPGTDYRVHVIGDEIFACAITSPSDDYRYATAQGATTEIHSCELPIDIENRCVALARALRMSVVGVDLRARADGRWYCFEVNPSPAFTYYQQATGQPMARAVARLLGAGSTEGRKPNSAVRNLIPP